MTDRARALAGRLIARPSEAVAWIDRLRGAGLNLDDDARVEDLVARKSFRFIARTLSKGFSVSLETFERTALEYGEVDPSGLSALLTDADASLSHEPTEALVLHLEREVQAAEMRPRLMAAQEALARGDLEIAQARAREAAEVRRGPGSPGIPEPIAVDDGVFEAPPKREGLFYAPGSDAVLMPRGKVGLLAATGGTGKSWALAQLAAAVSCGCAWFGFRPARRDGRVLVFFGEEDAGDIREKIHFITRSLIETFKVDDERVRWSVRNLVEWVPLVALDATLIAAGEDHRGQRTHAETAFASALRRRYAQHARGPWDLIIFDPVARFAGLEAEKDAAIATRFVESLEAWTKLDGNPTVIAAHHVRKGTGSDPKELVRGSSALTDGARWVAVMSGPDERDEATGDLTPAGALRVVKNSYGPRPTSETKLYRRRGYAGVLEARRIPAPVATSRRLANGRPFESRGGASHG